MGLADADHVAEQYEDASRLDARVRLYELYSTATQSWHAWAFDHLGLQPADRVLEVGCGVGNLWAENAARVHPAARLTLSDRSGGMVDAARRRLSSRMACGTSLVVADAQQLPFAAGSFDVLLADHMLYHVPDRAAAYREFARVLGPAARVVVGTNGGSHLLELRKALDAFGVRSGMLAANIAVERFDLERARSEIEEHFARAGVHTRCGRRLAGAADQRSRELPDLGVCGLRRGLGAPLMPEERTPWCRLCAKEVRGGARRQRGARRRKEALGRDGRGA